VTGITFRSNLSATIWLSMASIKCRIIAKVTVRVMGVEEFPDWVDLIAFGVLAVQGVLWRSLPRRRSRQ
jgi:hypothetical protein